MTPEAMDHNSDIHDMENATGIALPSHNAGAGPAQCVIGDRPCGAGSTSSTCQGMRSCSPAPGPWQQPVSLQQEEAEAPQGSDKHVSKDGAPSSHHAGHQQHVMLLGT